MAMRWLEGEPRKTGDVFDELLADQIADRREARGDIPLPEKELPVTQRFSEKAKEALEKNGMLVFELTGQSISTLRDKGYPFFSTWHQGNEELEDTQSRLSEIAIDPKQIFLLESNGISYEERERLITSYGQDLQIPDAEAVIGQMPDYLELVFQHLDKTGEELFGEKYGYLFTVTDTLLNDQRINVGHFVRDEGIVVNNLMSDRERSERVFVTPIIVPASV